MTESGNDLWRQLGITPTTDEGAIRRAYAKRLREVRPDDDPAGFQQLVETRDRALWLARHSKEFDEPERPSDDDEPDAGLQPAVRIEEVGARPVPLTVGHAEPVVSPSPAADRHHDGAERAAMLDLLDTVLHASSDAGLLPAWLTRTPASDSAPPFRPADADWQEIAKKVAHLSMADRAMVQPDIIRRLSAYASRQGAAFAEWPAASWPFFNLAAQLDAEFGWRRQDRIVHLYLLRGDADRFMALLAWAHDVNAGPDDVIVRPASGLPNVRTIDLYAFYDGGRDQPGLLAWRTMASDRRLWRPNDSATNLFFLLWSLHDGHYLKAAMGLIGWTGLLAAYAPWRSPAVVQALPWIVPASGSALEAVLDLWPLLVAVWIMLGTTNLDAAMNNRRIRFFGDAARREVPELPNDRDAAIFFPFWAIARGLYLRGAIGLLAWGAVVHQMLMSGKTFPDLAGPVFLAACLHGLAGTCGQRWVAYKFLRTVATADRAGVLDPAARMRYIQRLGTTDLKIFQKAGRAITLLWNAASAFGVFFLFMVLFLIWSRYR